MMSSLSFFPHEIIREGQDKLIADLQKAFADKKILLAHAPTGLGKTASALAVAVEYALKEKKRVFFLTNRHTQHRIAIDTLRLMQLRKGLQIRCVDFIGKRWMCNQEIAGVFGNDFNEYCHAVVEKGECEFYNAVRSKKGLTVEAQAHLSSLGKQHALHTEEFISLTQEKRMCSYEIALEMAKKADVIIGDYYYIFNPFVHNALFTKLNLELEDTVVIVDEGHNLPGRVVEMISSKLSSIMLRNGVMEAKKFGYPGVVHWLQEMMHILQNLGVFTGEKERLVKKEELTEKIQKMMAYDELVNQLNMAADEIRKKQKKSYLGGIASFLDAWKGQDEGFARILNEHPGAQGSVLTLHYSCLDAALVTRDVFSRMAAGVVMSGTLQPMSMYKDVLGIEKAMEREYFSPFPPENKLSLVVPETTTKYGLRGETMYKQIALKCSELAEGIPGNVALFFPSYELRDRIGYYFASPKQKFWEKQLMSKEEKDIFLAEFKAQSMKGAVLLGVTGANFAEGVDFPGEVLKGVVIVGLPLGRPDLRTKELITHYDKKFSRGWEYGYIFPAISKCIQSAGRCIRSATDKGAIIFLDERFAWQKYFTCLPRDGLRVTKEYSKVLNTFWK